MKVTQQDWTPCLTAEEGNLLVVLVNELWEEITYYFQAKVFNY